MDISIGRVGYNGEAGGLMVGDDTKTESGGSAGGRAHSGATSAAEPDDRAEELIDNVFPTEDADSPNVTLRVLEAMPTEAFSTSPEEFSTFLEGLFLTEDELDSAFEEFLEPGTAGEGITLARRVRALVPPEVLEASNTAGFIDQVFDVFDEIDEVLAAFAEEAGPREPVEVPQAVTAIVPEEAIADPLELIRAVDRVDTETQKLSLLFRQARHALRGLRAYRLTKLSPGQILSEMRSADHLPTLQYLVDFLSAIQQAATSFEELELPRPHIRDYLEHLYRMEDWQGMATLVHRLEKSVQRYVKDAE